jgi:TM2 domain-containing membrane protein YozV
MTEARTTDPAVIEHRLLDLAYTTDAPITAPLLAYYTPCSIEDAENVLDRLVTENRLRMEIDEEGNLTYVIPSRQRLSLPRPVALERRPEGTLAHTRPPNPATAAILSLLVPGAGQLYAGRPVSAILWFAAVTLGYLMLIFPGLVLHVLCIASAAGTAHHVRATTA